MVVLWQKINQIIYFNILIIFDKNNIKSANKIILDYLTELSSVGRAFDCSSYSNSFSLVGIKMSLVRFRQFGNKSHYFGYSYETNSIVIFIYCVWSVWSNYNCVFIQSHISVLHTVSEFE